MRSNHNGGRRRVVFLLLSGAELTDFAGPFAVFSRAAQLHDEYGILSVPKYEVRLVGSAKTIDVSWGLKLFAQTVIDREPTRLIDTIIVPGGVGILETSSVSLATSQWLRRAGVVARRVCSVCTGAFALARTGLLKGKRVTTHWAFCDQLASEFPDVTVDREPIFTRDGNIYTSAGVTAGIDLALALVEEDYGHKLALQIAREMVVFLKRPGSQLQFSQALRLQSADRTPIRNLQTWLIENLKKELNVESLAERVNMSPRNFARAFKRELGTTPAAYIEQLRVDSAKSRLAESRRSVKEIADLCGFKTVESFRRAFARQTRVSPLAYRARFQSNWPSH
ncbi:MAG: GlxA family transcriptional regulator [Acidobacteria bacterium]|nr:GlxA family transcriptional regulator [Acidobacteriota bacterium]MBV9624645.1 GlxA family transcriptional regulator [Acidobacteriota bacterium]